MAQIAGRFARVEPRRRVGRLVLGLLSDLPRKNCWTIAEWAGDKTPDGMQHLLGRAKWDADQVRDDVRAYVVEHLHDYEALLVVDETGDVKKGTDTVGVQRQYTGTAGRIENAQVAVYLVYAGRRGHAAADRELYVPRSWTSDPDRCRAAGLGDKTEFATEPELAARMVTRFLDAGHRAAWVAGDEVYGGNPRLHAARRSRSRTSPRPRRAPPCPHHPPPAPLDGPGRRRGICPSEDLPRPHRIPRHRRDRYPPSAPRPHPPRPRGLPRLYSTPKRPCAAPAPHPVSAFGPPSWTAAPWTATASPSPLTTSVLSPPKPTVSRPRPAPVPRFRPPARQPRTPPRRDPSLPRHEHPGHTITPHRRPLPSRQDVRNDIDTITSETGRVPSVLALATRFQLAHTTFRRNYPDICDELTRSPGASRSSNRAADAFSRLKTDNDRLRRANRHLTEQPDLAIAAIQRLSVDNDRLRTSLNDARAVTPPCPASQTTSRGASLVGRPTHAAPWLRLVPL
ncbi:IS701 family transposase [Streptomyces sp. NPDC056948]|uniref:IS701 family transposase n=1 Tax=Streptomyces sp. NPDC056948 TaxID=3345975 RepID=UPI0036391CEA